MSEVWWDQADTESQNFDDSNYHRGPIANGSGVGMKLLLHSVEGSGWPSYNGGSSAPHFTVQFNLQMQTATWRQHWPVDRYARALKSDGRLINNGGPIQVEICGTSGWATPENPNAPYHVVPVVPDLPEWCWAEIARLLVWCHQKHGVELNLVPGGFVPWTRSSRLSYDEWVKFSGLIGHQHAPANDHTDPGDIPGEKIIDFARQMLDGTYEEDETVKYPSRSSSTFWYDLPKVLRHEGYQIYDDPTYVDRGFCYYGSPTHKHSQNSLHFRRRAIDFGRDPSGGAAVSNYEQAYVDAKMLMLRDYYKIGGVWRRGPNDHMDHGHLEDSGWWQVNYSGYKVEGIILYGEVSDRVRAWQQKLRKAGQTLTADGIFRLGTFWATKAWQRQRGLLDDGIIGGGSQREMDKHLAELSAPKPIDWAEIYKNYTTEMVKEAQFVLHDLGYAVGVIDGIPGPKFNAAVKEAQTDYKITPVDGFPGPNTMKVLKAELERLNTPVKPAPVEPEPVKLKFKLTELSGSSGPQTADMLSQQLQPNFVPGKVYIAARGTDDLAIAGGDGFVLLANNRAENAPSATLSALRRLAITELVFVGGLSVIPQQQRDQMIRAANE